MCSTLAVAGILWTGLLLATAMVQTCKVTHPTNAPWKVRTVPYGKIMGMVKKVTVVYITEYRYEHNSLSWLMVFNAKHDRYIGWVYWEFISRY